MMDSLVSWTRKNIYQHRARWTCRKLRPFVKKEDRVLDIGAGDCRLVKQMQKRIGCEVVPVDVEDFNVTDVPLTLFDGKRLPFENDSFDVALLVFVLHHAEEVEPLLQEARRVARRSVVVFEDVTTGFWDQLMFRSFHRWLEWSERISFPFREWPPPRWTKLAESLGFSQRKKAMVGAQLPAFGCRHVVFVWDKKAFGGNGEAPPVA